MAVKTASFSSVSSGCLSNRLIKIATAFWYSIDVTKVVYHKQRLTIERKGSFYTPLLLLGPGFPIASLCLMNAA
jgi:hypothetical protein